MLESLIHQPEEWKLTYKNQSRIKVTLKKVKKKQGENIEDDKNGYFVRISLNFTSCFRFP